MKLSHPDTYENRALFLMTWHGDRTEKLFPEWHKKLWSFKPDSVDRTIWLANFCAEGLAMKKKQEEGVPGK